MSSKLKQLATREDEVVVVECPVPGEKILDRHLDYPSLPPIKFAKKYGDMFQPVEIEFKNTRFQIQANHCTNPYCKWFGLPQKRFVNVKGKPHRYKLTGSLKHVCQRFACNPDPVASDKNGTTWAAQHNTTSL